MNILVLNCGSSSLKFQLIDMTAERRLARGLIERIGGNALCTYQPAGREQVRHSEPLRSHEQAIERVIRWLSDPESDARVVDSVSEVHAVGHRVVHGGEAFSNHTHIDERVIRAIEDCMELAPLHNPANIKGIRASRRLLGDHAPMAAVFDTVFHSTMPESSYLYAIPYQLYRRHKIRRYGFHGTSHAYLAGRYASLLGKPQEAVKIVTLHLGNGCSACAIREGKSFATSMGFTPLEGLVMGTRSGSIDPSLVEHIAMKEGLGAREVDSLLNKQSGLFGISGLTNDMRELLEEERENGDRRAALAIELFVASIKHYLGAYLALMNGAEAIVFSGGIGENSPAIRERVCRNLEWLGICLDEARNDQLGQGGEGDIATADSRVRIYVIPTDEELMIARETAAVLSKETV